MAGDDAKDELKISPRTLALAIETAIHALSPDAIERVMIAIFQEDHYRAYLGAAAKRTGEVTDAAVGEAVNRTLVRDGLGESFYPFFTSEVLKSIFRVRFREGVRYGREAFKREFSDLARALDQEALDVAEDGELCRAGTGEGAETEAPPVNTAWVTTCDRDLLDSAREILRAILQQMDLDITAKHVTIGRHEPTEGGFRPLPDQARSMTEYRERLLNMLAQRGVIKTWTPQAGRYGSVENFIIEADRHAVADTLRAIEDLFSGRSRRQEVTEEPPARPAPVPPTVPLRSSLPKNQQDALPVEPKRKEGFWHKVRDAFATELGKKLAIGAIALGGAVGTWFIPPIRAWALSLIDALLGRK